MSAMTNYLENKLLDFLLRGQAFVAPTTAYVALFTAMPDENGGGTEVSGNAYARKAIPCSSTDWAGTQGVGTTGPSSGATGTTSNNATQTFPTPTGSWGTIVGAGVFDAASGGNLLIYGALDAAQVVNAGNTVSFAPGLLSFQIDN